MVSGDQINDANMGRHAAPRIKSRAFRSVSVAVANRHWVRSDPFASAFFNCLSAVFPTGESFMIRSLRPLQKKVPEPLNTQICAFIQQEAGHSREHIAMNKVLVAAGYDVKPLEKAIRKFVGSFQNQSTIIKVGATMCIEHITAIVAAEVLRNDYHLDGSDAELKELWLWHAVEEVEHKAVAFDVWMYLTRNWSPLRRWCVRSAMMLTISTTFLFNRTRGQLELLSQDGYRFRAALSGALKSGFGRGGIGRNILKNWAHFFKPGFHPWDINDRILIAKGENMFAKNAADQDVSTERRTRPRLAKAA